MEIKSFKEFLMEDLPPGSNVISIKSKDDFKTLLLGKTYIIIVSKYKHLICALRLSKSFHRDLFKQFFKKSGDAFDKGIKDHIFLPLIATVTEDKNFDLPITHFIKDDLGNEWKNYKENEFNTNWAWLKEFFSGSYFNKLKNELIS